MNPARYRIVQMANSLDLLLVDKSEIVNDIQFSSGLGASDHLAYSAYLLCDPEIPDSETLKYNFHKGDYVSINKELVTITQHECSRKLGFLPRKVAIIN